MQSTLPLLLLDSPYLPNHPTPFLLSFLSILRKQTGKSKRETKIKNYEQTNKKEMKTYKMHTHRYIHTKKIKT